VRARQANGAAALFHHQHRVLIGRDHQHLIVIPRAAALLGHFLSPLLSLSSSSLSSSPPSLPLVVETI
jgi:hypothetical protein